MTQQEIDQARGDLYHLVQQQCDRPAYFWYNYKWSSSTDAKLLLLGNSFTTDQLILMGYAFEIKCQLVINNDLAKNFCKNT